MDEEMVLELFTLGFLHGETRWTEEEEGEEDEEEAAEGSHQEVQQSVHVLALLIVRGVGRKIGELQSEWQLQDV